MPPSPLDDRIVVALPRPIRPQELKLCLDTSYLDSVTTTSKTVISTTVVKIRATNLTYMPSSNGSTRSLSCGCSSASCCTVTTYEKDSQTQSQVSVSSPNLSSGVCFAGPTNQMVNNNEALSAPAGIGSPTSGSAKSLSAVRVIYPNELAKRISRCPKGHQGSPGTVIIDCRPFMEYNKSHIQGAVHINCSDKISRRRLQQGKITVLDLISCREGKDSFKRIFSKEIVVYDENTNEPNRVMPSQPLHVVLESLKREGKDPLVLKGMHFLKSNGTVRKNYISLKNLTSGGIPHSLPTTPDIENAELTPVLPFLYLGNEHDAQDFEKMQKLNIGYIINVTTHLPLFHYEQGIFNYKRLPATDSNKQNLRQYFEEAFEFIEEAHQSGKGLLIHCQAGVSRSATIVIAYLMKHTRMTMTDAYKFVKTRRPIISPNLNFMGQLLEFEEDLNNGITPRILTPKLIGVETVV
ncbi:DUS10 phosphatase, partial [Amia calva]|nr:DUS10 phosphatase [Amia calva]